jgi:hypothetical protein
MSYEGVVLFACVCLWLPAVSRVPRGAVYRYGIAIELACVSRTDGLS